MKLSYGVWNLPGVGALKKRCRIGFKNEFFTYRERKIPEGPMLKCSYSVFLGMVPFIDWKDSVMSHILVEGKRNI